MKKLISLWALCFFLHLSIGSSLVFSQEASPERTWTLDECIQTALKNRPELEISNLDILQAEYQIKEAESSYYPHLNLTAGYTRFNGPTIIDTDVDVSALTKPINPWLPKVGIPVELPTTIHETFPVGKTNWTALTVDLTQPVYTFGRISEGIKQAHLGRSFIVNQREKKGAEVVFEVKKAYYQLVAAKEMVQLLKETEVRTEVVSKMVKIAYETTVPGKEEKGTTRIDYLKVRNFDSEAKTRLSEMKRNVKLAGLALKMAMGLDLDSPMDVTGGSFEELGNVRRSLVELKETTLSKNIDLKSAELGVRFFDSKRKAATKEYFPKIGIQGQYVGPEDRFGNRNTWYAGIGLTVPIFDGFLTRAKVGQAETQLQKIKDQKLILEKGLSAKIDQLDMSLTEIRERIQLLQEAIPEARERMNLASEGYSAGITEFDEVLLAQRTELEMRSNYLQSLLFYQTIKAEIEFTSGTR